MTPAELIAFERRVADLFNDALIPYPIHLSSGNEQALIDIFERVGPNDWVLGTWRSHYHCLLKGVPSEEVLAAIKAGQSIALSFPERRILCSAIAGGMLPVAVGLGMAIKRTAARAHVWCFTGDMMARSGIAHESMQYAANHKLPVTWVVEDNGISVCTETRKAWGEDAPPDVIRYEYVLEWPHAGSGRRIEF